MLKNYLLKFKVYNTQPLQYTLIKLHILFGYVKREKNEYVLMILAHISSYKSYLNSIDEVKY